MKGIYLASYRADHPGHNIVYQDINGLRDIPGDMMTVDLSQYDYVRVYTVYGKFITI